MIGTMAGFLKNWLHKNGSESSPSAADRLASPFEKHTIQAEIHGVTASIEKASGSVQGHRALVGIRRAGKPLKDKEPPKKASRLNFRTTMKSVDDYSDRIEESGADTICSVGEVAVGSAINLIR